MDVDMAVYCKRSRRDERKLTWCHLSHTWINYVPVLTDKVDGNFKGLMKSY